MLGLVFGGQVNATNAKYSASGALCSLQNGTNVISTFTFNNRLQPNRMQVTTTGAPLTPCDPPSATPGNVMDFSYSFNAGVANNGNVASIVNNRAPGRSQSFTYDELNRIKTAATQDTTGTNAWGLQFSYDAWGNLFPASVTQGSAQTVGATPDQTNRIAGYCYDAAGNLIFAGSCGATQTYQYDAENRITTTAGVTYSYDGDGRRVAKSNGKTYWYGLGSDPLVESDGLGTISDEYIFFGGKRIARRAPSGFLGYSTFYNFADHLGTARVILQDGTTSPCFDADYYPFGGERTPVVNSCPQNYKFTGKERDAESGLDYFIARYYSSGYGRFLSPDEFTGGPVDAFSASDPLPPGPLPYAEITNPQSLNKYTYAFNDPLNFVDPDGHQTAGVKEGIQLLKELTVIMLEGGSGTEVAAAAAPAVPAASLAGPIGLVAAAAGLLVTRIADTLTANNEDKISQDALAAC